MRLPGSSGGLAQSDTDLTLLCEGDMTFRAFDIDKFMAYIPYSEIVNGTRIVEQLRDRMTQLSTCFKPALVGQVIAGRKRPKRQRSPCGQLPASYACQKNREPFPDIVQSSCSRL